MEDEPLLPIDSGRKGAGEIVDPAWEGRSGHAVAALRYGVMVPRGASPPADPEDWANWARAELLRPRR